MNFHLMAVEFAKPLTDKFPDAITYVDGRFVLTGEMPEDFEGKIVDLSILELSNEELTAYVDGFIESIPTGRLVIVSQTQGEWILANHPKFKQESAGEP